MDNPGSALLGPFRKRKSVASQQCSVYAGVSEANLFIFLAVAIELTVSRPK